MALLVLGVSSATCACKPKPSGVQASATKAKRMEMTGKNLADDVALLVAASGATRLALSQDGMHAVAELAGPWYEETYGVFDQAPAPPLLKVIDLVRDAVTTTATGWLLAPPTGDSGPWAAGFYLGEDSEELRYSVRSFQGNSAFPLHPPPASSPGQTSSDDVWAVKLTSVAAGRLLVGLWRPALAPTQAERPRRRQDLWLASIAPGEKPTIVSRQMTLLTSRAGNSMYGGGYALHPSGKLLYLADIAQGPGPAGPITIHALDPQTLATRWSTGVERPRGGLAEASGDLSVQLSTDGAGDTLVVLMGAWSAQGTVAERALLIDAHSGQIRRALTGPTVLSLWTVTAMLGAAKQQVAMPACLESGRGATRKQRFLGLRVLDTESGELHSGFDAHHAPASPRDDLLPQLCPAAWAWDRKGSRWWVAASSYAWVRAAGIPIDVSQPVQQTGQDSGRNRPEVKDLIRTPPTWYQPGRPRIDIWLALRSRWQD